MLTILYIFDIANKSHEKTKTTNGLVHPSTLSDFPSVSVKLGPKPVYFY